MGQISVEKSGLPGSDLSGNQHSCVTKLGAVSLDAPLHLKVSATSSGQHVRVDKKCHQISCFFMMGSGYVPHVFRDAVYLGLPIVRDCATTADRLYDFLLLSVAHFVAHLALPLISLVYC